jgi:hypothetical protein
MAILPAFWRIDEFVKAANGYAMANAQVFFLAQPANTSAFPPTPQVQLYSDPFGLTPIPQPLVADGYGFVYAYVAAGTYTMVVALSNVIQNIYADQSYGLSSAQVLFETNGVPNANQGLLNLVGAGDVTVNTNALGQTVIESTGTALLGTGTGIYVVTAFSGVISAPAGDILTADGSGNAQDSGVQVSSLAPLLNPVFPNQIIVTGYTDMEGNANVGGNLTVGGTLGITGAATIGGALGVTGQITATGYVDMTANVNVGGNLTVGGTLGITGAATIGGALGVTGQITAAGYVDMTANANVTGNLSTGNIIDAGYATIGGTLGVTGVTTLTSLIANSLNTNIVIADEFAGADLGIQINAAFTQLGSARGEVWVIKPLQTTLSTAVTVGDFQTLRFWPGVYTISYSGGGVVFTLGNYACIIGMGTAGNSVNMGLNGAANCSAVVTNSSTSNQAMTVSGLYIDSGTDSPTVTTATLYFNELGQLSKCEDCIIVPPNSSTAPAILFNACGDVLCRHNWVNGTGSSIGVGGIKYTTAINSQGTFFEDNITEHLAASTSLLQTYGLFIEATGGATLKNVHVLGHHCEQDVADTGSGIFAGVYINGSGCQGGTIINASLTQNAGSYGIVVRLNACTNYTVIDVNGYSALYGIDDNHNSTTLVIPVPFYTQAVLATGGVVGVGNGSSANLTALAKGTGTGPASDAAAGWMEITVAGQTRWLPYFS